MIAYIEAAWDDSPDTKIHIAAVHRLSNCGALVTHVARGTSQAGFDAEWRDIHLLDGRRQTLSRSELFDEADLDTALARFDELSRPVPEPWVTPQAKRPHASAEQFAAQDWNAMTELLADDYVNDDRRRVETPGSDTVGTRRSPTCGRSRTVDHQRAFDRRRDPVRASR